MKNISILFILIICGLIIYLIKSDKQHHSNGDQNKINLKLTSNNDFFIDNVKTEITEIQKACDYGGCAGPEPIVHLYLDKSISMSLLDSIENELLKVDILRVEYHKF